MCGHPTRKKAFSWNLLWLPQVKALQEKDRQTYEPRRRDLGRKKKIFLHTLQPTHGDKDLLLLTKSGLKRWKLKHKKRVWKIIEGLEDSQS